MDKEIETLCKSLHSILTMGKLMTAIEIENDYKELFYESISYEKYNVNGVEDFMKKYMERYITCSRSAEGKMMFAPKSLENTKHMADLINRTKSKKKLPSKSQKGHFTGLACYKPLSPFRRKKKHPVPSKSSSNHKIHPHESSHGVRGTYGLLKPKLLVHKKNHNHIDNSWINSAGDNNKLVISQNDNKSLGNYCISVGDNVEAVDEFEDEYEDVEEVPVSRSKNTSTRRRSRKKGRSDRATSSTMPPRSQPSNITLTGVSDATSHPKTTTPPKSPNVVINNNKNVVNETDLTLPVINYKNKVYNKTQPRVVTCVTKNNMGGEADEGVDDILVELTRKRLEMGNLFSSQDMPQQKHWQQQGVVETKGRMMGDGNGDGPNDVYLSRQKELSVQHQQHEQQKQSHQQQQQHKHEKYPQQHISQQQQQQPESSQQQQHTGSKQTYQQQQQVQKQQQQFINLSNLQNQNQNQHLQHQQKEQHQMRQQISQDYQQQLSQDSTQQALQDLQLQMLQDFQQKMLKQEQVLKNISQPQVFPSVKPESLLDQYNYLSAQSNTSKLQLSKQQQQQQQTLQQQQQQTLQQQQQQQQQQTLQQQQHNLLQQKYMEYFGQQYQQYQQQKPVENTSDYQQIISQYLQTQQYQKQIHQSQQNQQQSLLQQPPPPLIPPPQQQLLHQQQQQQQKTPPYMQNVSGQQEQVMNMLYQMVKSNQITPQSLQAFFNQQQQQPSLSEQLSSQQQLQPPPQQKQKSNQQQQQRQFNPQQQQFSQQQQQFNPQKQQQHLGQQQQQQFAQHMSKSPLDGLPSMHQPLPPMNLITSSKTPSSIIPPTTSMRNIPPPKLLSSQLSNQSNPLVAPSMGPFYNTQGSHSNPSNYPSHTFSSGQQSSSQAYTATARMSNKQPLNEPLVTIDHFMNPYDNATSSNKTTKDYKDSASGVSHHKSPFNQLTNPSAGKNMDNFNNATSSNAFQNSSNFPATSYKAHTRDLGTSGYDKGDIDKVLRVIKASSKIPDQQAPAEHVIDKEAVKKHYVDDRSNNNKQYTADSGGNNRQYSSDKTSDNKPLMSYDGNNNDNTSFNISKRPPFGNKFNVFDNFEGKDNADFTLSKGNNISSFGVNNKSNTNINIKSPPPPHNHNKINFSSPPPPNHNNINFSSPTTLNNNNINNTNISSPKYFSNTNSATSKSPDNNAGISNKNLRSYHSTISSTLPPVTQAPVYRSISLPADKELAVDKKASPVVTASKISLEDKEEVLVEGVCSVQQVKGTVISTNAAVVFKMAGLDGLQVDFDYLCILLTGHKYHAAFKHSDGVVSGVLYRQQGDKVVNVNKTIIEDTLSLSLVPLQNHNGKNRLKYSKTELFSIRRQCSDSHSQINSLLTDFSHMLVKKEPEEVVPFKHPIKLASLHEVTQDGGIWLDFKTFDLAHLKEVAIPATPPGEASSKASPLKRSMHILKEGAITRLLCRLYGLTTVVWPGEAVAKLKGALQDDVVVEVHGREWNDADGWVVLVDVRSWQESSFVRAHILKLPGVRFLQQVRQAEAPRSGEEVFVTYIKTVTRFHAIPHKYFLSFSHLLKTMQDFYNNQELQEAISTWMGEDQVRRVGEVDVSVKEVDEGALYAVLFKDDNSWYRARVINKRSNDTASECQLLVTFVDTGYQEWYMHADVSSHFRLLLDHFRSLPLLSFEMTLAGTMRNTQTEKELKQKLLFKEFSYYPINQQDSTPCVVLHNTRHADMEPLVHYR